MTDVALHWDAVAGAADILLVDGAIDTDAGLRTAILISLFTDACAAADDVLPQPGGDRRGWWGDALAEGSDVTGSLLWLLAREKITPRVLTRAREYAEKALAWLIADKVASKVTVTAEALRPGTLALRIEIVRPSGPARQRFDYVWDAEAGWRMTA
ncbi:MAG: hypothetical protein EOP62_14410 [Sphingomonadales bacterium]|nr:MAG: hypothetical protein EOP62_14410 [Sphingomonadales bacterium]